MVHKILFWAGFGTFARRRAPCDPSADIALRRHRDTHPTTRHRDAALLPTRLVMGLHTIRWRRGIIRLLDERRGGSTDEDAAAAERDHNREAETEGGERDCATTGAEGGGGYIGERERLTA